MKLLFVLLKQNAGMLYTQFCCCMGISLLKYFSIIVNHLQLPTEIFPFFKFTFKGVGDANHQVPREENSGGKNSDAH